MAADSHSIDAAITLSVGHAEMNSSLFSSSVAPLLWHTQPHRESSERKAAVTALQQLARLKSAQLIAPVAATAAAAASSAESASDSRCHSSSPAERCAS